MKNTIFELNDSERDTISAALLYMNDLNPHPDFEVVLEKVLSSKSLNLREIGIVYNSLNVFKIDTDTALEKTPVISKDYTRLVNLSDCSDKLIRQLAPLAEKIDFI